MDRKKTSCTGRGFFIHKEQLRLGASQHTKGQNWSLLLNDFGNGTDSFVSCIRV